MTPSVTTLYFLFNIKKFQGVKAHLKLAPVFLTQLTRKATTHADINNKAAKKSKYPYFLSWTAIAMVDFFDLYRKKGDCICVIFS